MVFPSSMFLPKAARASAIVRRACSPPLPFGMLPQPREFEQIRECRPSGAATDERRSPPCPQDRRSRLSEPLSPPWLVNCRAWFFGAWGGRAWPRSVSSVTAAPLPTTPGLSALLPLSICRASRSGCTGCGVGFPALAWHRNPLFKPVLFGVGPAEEPVEQPLATVRKHRNAEPEIASTSKPSRTVLCRRLAKTAPAVVQHGMDRNSKRKGHLDRLRADLTGYLVAGACNPAGCHIGRSSTPKRLRTPI